MKTAAQIIAIFAFASVISSCASEEKSTERYTGYSPEQNNTQMLQSDQVYSTVPTPPNKRNILRSGARASSSTPNQNTWDSNYNQD